MLPVNFGFGLIKLVMTMLEITYGLAEDVSSGSGLVSPSASTSTVNEILRKGQPSTSKQLTGKKSKTVLQKQSNVSRRRSFLQNFVRWCYD